MRWKQSEFLYEKELIFWDKNATMIHSYSQEYDGGNWTLGKEREQQMDVQVGDTLKMKKSHPCGEVLFDVLRVGMDFKIRCKKCGREVMVPRVKIEKNIKEILKKEL